MIKLYTYYRSTAAYRVRIALNLKGLHYSSIYVNLREDQHLTANYHALNPQCMVPLLIDDGHSVNQSLSIIDFLEEKYPTPSLYPAGLGPKSRSRSFAQIITSDIHPLNNLRVMKYLKNECGLSEEQTQKWYHHWIQEGFDVLEYYLRTNPTKFCYGHVPTLADICLVPQVYNAKRYEFDLSHYPRICAVNDACLDLEAFHNAAPEQQGDCLAT